MTDLFNLKGKVALVTGGSRGIGAAIVHALCAQGVSTAFTYASDHDAAKTVEEQAGDSCIMLHADTADVSEAHSVVDQCITRFGKLDILVVNAGITRDRVVWKLSEEDWNAVLETNLKGAFAIVSAAVPHFRSRQTGKIITMASINGLRGKAGQGAYAASKGGLIAFTKSMAKELGTKSINVNAIAPGLIETDMTRQLSDTILQTARDETALNRLGQPNDVANAVLFLASDLSSHITGQVLNVDGGQLI